MTLPSLSRTGFLILTHVIQPAKVIGSFLPQPAGGWDDPINLSTKISGGYSGEHEIYFKFVPVDHALRIESLTF